MPKHIESDVVGKNSPRGVPHERLQANLLLPRIRARISQLWWGILSPLVLPPVCILWTPGPSRAGRASKRELPRRFSISNFPIWPAHDATQTVSRWLSMHASGACVEVIHRPFGRTSSYFSNAFVIKFGLNRKQYSQSASTTIQNTASEYQRWASRAARQKVKTPS